jgi:hypothetical protein
VAREGTEDAVDRGPRHAGQPVHLAPAQARTDRGPDDLVAPATGRVLPGGPAGQPEPSPQKATDQSRSSTATVMKKTFACNPSPIGRGRAGRRRACMVVKSLPAPTFCTGLAGTDWPGREGQRAHDTKTLRAGRDVRGTIPGSCHPSDIMGSGQAEWRGHSASDVDRVAGARAVAAGGRGGGLVAKGGRRWGWRVSGLPDGVVTFLFSDIEGSTRLVKALQEEHQGDQPRGCTTPVSSIS